jgi:hypothetical protein
VNLLAALSCKAAVCIVVKLLHILPAELSFPSEEQPSKVDHPSMHAINRYIAAVTKPPIDSPFGENGM